MRARETTLYAAHLVPLAAVWGASYLFIEVAIDELAPTVLMEIRLLLASAVLAGLLIARDGASAVWSSLRRLWRPTLVLGFLNASVPFTLIAWAQTRIDSGVAAITIATVPIFVVLLALRFRRSEHV